MPHLDADRLFDAEPKARGIARALYAGVKDLPLVSPHGHTDPRWYAENEKFPDPAQLLIVPDHYVFRMLYSQGIRLEDLGVPTTDGSKVETDGRTIWRRFAENYFLFRGTPTRMWLDHTFETLFGLDELLTAKNADRFYDTISEKLQQDAFRPRALFERFNLEVISTTDSAIDPLPWHKMIRDSKWKGRVVPAYRPDAVVDPDFDGFSGNLDTLGEISGEDTGTWSGYLAAHRNRRAHFISFGATSSDHGHPSAETANLGFDEADALFGKVRSGKADAARAANLPRADADRDGEDEPRRRAHAPDPSRVPGAATRRRSSRSSAATRASISRRAPTTSARSSRCSMRSATNPISPWCSSPSTRRAMRASSRRWPASIPRCGSGRRGGSTTAPKGMRRFREMATETAGFYNTVGFNDDTRAFPSIPARHDVARRVDCAFLARLVTEHRLGEDEAHEVAKDLAYNLVKKAYKL